MMEHFTCYETYRYHLPCIDVGADEEMSRLCRRLRETPTASVVSVTGRNMSDAVDAPVILGEYAVVVVVVAAVITFVSFRFDLLTSVLVSR